MVYNLEYLNNLIESKLEESLYLEYKSAASLDKQNNKTTEISKDVSAFANSDGGVLIYGIHEDDKNELLPKSLDPICKKDFSKEWLEQIIQDKIQPRLEKIKIHPIEIDSNQIIYVVEIEKSNTAHQAFDKKYYKRFNFNSTAMNDYEIRDIFNRAKNPEISLEFRFIDQRKRLEVIARNISSTYAMYVNIKIKLSQSVLLNQYYKKVDDGNFEINLDNTIRDIIDTEFGIGSARHKYGPSRYEPILPTQGFTIETFDLTDHAFEKDSTISWEVFCDNATPKRGDVKFYDLLK
ncbi:putative DNA-binding protein [Flavobacterium araucananum]|uniref:Schlafen AlbA-2 domain-containing protein n=1 Tax=Flavobacterium araucananum TaxID=946678 RepID=A0A227P5B1_9FLAO|nr:ATP-binding protein [Flavobacterium araucananum]OXG05107.1 hypothetical protein B0A64_13845 [Flavobacterium araucananum]PWJ96824.1 putative DNA-binding protein [Flavobacterium araucananum]